MDRSTEQVTRILAKLSAGEDRAKELLPLVYDELRGLASRYLRHERIDHTLQPTALVHEAFLRMVNQPEASWQDRAHFYRVAAEAMRRILVNHARDRGRQKRGGGARKMTLQENQGTYDNETLDLLALDEAMTRLAAVDGRKVQVTELRYFGGFTLEETARILDISVAQVKRDWSFAKSWLLRELQRGEDHDPGTPATD
jgi:RNA polymerase sigma factor (TIGR02999 family)